MRSCSLHPLTHTQISLVDTPLSPMHDPRSLSYGSNCMFEPSRRCPGLTRQRMVTSCVRASCCASVAAI